MMLRAEAKLQERTGGRQDLNEKSPLLGKTDHPLVLVAKKSETLQMGCWGGLILHCVCTLQSFRAVENVEPTTAFKFTGVPKPVGACAWG